ncbi:MAG: hypothetical protein ACK5ES_20330, partial [Planctomyces sp.]
PWKNTFRTVWSELPDAKNGKYISFYLKFRESSGLQQGESVKLNESGVPSGVTSHACSVRLAPFFGFSATILGCSVFCSLVVCLRVSPPAFCPIFPPTR